MNNSSTAYIVGAGLSGLAAAVRLAESGRKVELFDSAGHAGGRCRTFYDKTLDRMIDNGNHLIMSGNNAALDYLKRIGAKDPLTGPTNARYPFVDIATGKRWDVEINEGLFPSWIFNENKRVPGSSVMDYIKAAGIMFAGPDATVADVVDENNVLYKAFWEPLTLAVLNTTPHIGQAKLLRSVIIRTFALGGGPSRPLAAREGLGPAFIDPAIKFLQGQGAKVHFNARLRDVGCENARLTSLEFTTDKIELQGGDEVIFALPPSRLKQLMPEFDPPEDNASILNVHYRIALADPLPAFGDSPLLGMVSSDAQWAFMRDDVISLTVSASHAIGLDDVPNKEVVDRLWRETQIGLDIQNMPYEAVRVIRERRATPDQSPGAVAKRVKAETQYVNLTLAGDHTDTGLPATIEGSIRSGDKAASLVLKRFAGEKAA